MARFDQSIDPDDETGGDDGDGEGWGSPEDLAAVIRHVAEGGAASDVRAGRADPHDADPPPRGA